MWLNNLPIKIDDIEGISVHGMLCTFIESNNQFLFGQNYSNLSKILSIFGTILGTKFVNEEVTKRIIIILKQMQTSMPGQLLSHAWGMLTSEQQQKLQRSMTST